MDPIGIDFDILGMGLKKQYGLLHLIQISLPSKLRPNYDSWITR
eukprot:SAG11_NODE_93_length_17080_cov_10.504093_9_plen_44_part_00